MELPNKKYQIINADPPWKFKYRHSSNDLTGHNEGIYPLMDLEDIKNLPIQKISDNDCSLFLWVTDPLLIQGLEVIKTWGFEYKTVAFTWIKTNPTNNKYWLGMGYWTRSNPEMCLLGTKGNIKRINSNIHQLIISHRKNHSHKPDEIRNRIIKLMGNLPRIELFARERIEGWDCYGNQLSDTIQKLIL